MTATEAGEHAAATMLVPIRKVGRVIGLLLIQNHRPGSYSESDLVMLQTLAEQCSGALERVQARDQLHESEQRFHDLFNNSPDAILVEDLAGTVLDVNSAACMLHGLPREQLIGKNALNNLIPPAQREAARGDFQKLAAGKLSWIESESLTATGSATPVEVRASRIEYGGKPALLLHVRDISARQAAAKALQSSETLFRSVWENSVDGMRLTDPNGLIVAVNDAYCKLVGMTPAALKGKPFTVVYATSEDWEAILNGLREHFRSRAPQRKRQQQHTLHDGRIVTMEITDTFIEVQGRPPLMLSLFRDITTQKRLEEQLRQAQKMEAIGQLAGGVAHDFNNILTVIHGHASLLAASGLNETGARSAHQITQAAERAAGLTRQLLTFSRRQLIQPKRLDMNKVVGNMTDMLGRMLGENVTLQLNYHDTPQSSRPMTGMMEQVLLNLAVNARDAMPRGGQLTMRVALVDSGRSARLAAPEARVGRFVLRQHVGHWLRHPAGKSAAHLRAFLHHQGSRQGHRSGPGHGLWDRQAAPGLAGGRKHRGRGQHLPHRPSVRRAELPAESEKPRRPVAVRGGTGNHSAGRGRETGARTRRARPDETRIPHPAGRLRGGGRRNLAARQQGHRRCC